MRGSMVVLGLCVVMTASCSRSPTLEYSFDLSVDGRPVIKEKASSAEKIAAMQERHRPWLEAVITACEFSNFTKKTAAAKSSITVYTKKAPTNPPSNGAKGKQDWTTEKELRSQTRFASVGISDHVVVCRSGLPGSGTNSDPSTNRRGCSPLAGAESGTQQQYPLQLRAFLQSQHGMSVGAAWRFDKLERGASGENTRLIRDEVSITQDGYVCVRQLKSNVSE